MISKKISTIIAAKLERMILEGVFAKGARLPAERALSEQLEVSRPSLREALKELSAKGLIISKQGGGTFVTETVGQVFRDPLLALINKYPEAQKDLLEFRLTLEMSCAYYAAKRATVVDLERLGNAFEKIERGFLDESCSTQSEAEADAAFHLTIAEASHNVILLQIMQMLFDLIKYNIVMNIGGLHAFNKDTRARLVEQHRALYTAIVEKDPEQAKRIAGGHIRYVQEVLERSAEEHQRVEQSIRRQSSQGKTE